MYSEKIEYLVIAKLQFKTGELKQKEKMGLPKQATESRSSFNCTWQQMKKG